MGLTIVEKIVSQKIGCEVRAGEVVWLPLDYATARDFGGASVVKNFMEAYGNEQVFNPARVIFTFDCNAPANTVGYATNQMICRQFAGERGLRVYDVDAGIGSHIMIEEAYAFPGATLVGTDSHYNILGAVGALGLGMGDLDVTFAFRNGKVWFEIPPTVRVNVEGTFSEYASAKDLTLAIVKHFGSDGLIGKCVEFYGDIIDCLNLEGRITLASMATEMGAVSAFIPPNDSIIEELKGFSSITPEPTLADKDAYYTEEITLKLGKIEPMVAMPYSPDNVVKVKEISKEKIRVHSGFIGSCTNGRTGDFRSAAEILDGSSIFEGTTLRLVPATRRVFAELLRSGMMEKLFNAGALISNQGCGGCASGQIGITGEGEVQVSTSNRNFKGKQGAGRTFLASPVTVAESVKKGYITAPGVK